MAANPSLSSFGESTAADKGRRRQPLTITADGHAATERRPDGSLAAVAYRWLT